ncbi:cytochrome P450 [Streptomyces sp. NPDC057011]|uniref:cytochrome P450 n=1 Tax=unclassified Streptomyces TaxID=2593676 RepID=UPI00363BB1F1
MHTRIRALINGAFAAKSMRQHQPVIERRAQALAARLLARGRPFDAVAGFCVPYAFGIHCDLLGVPQEFRLRLYRWSWARAADPDAGPEQKRTAETELHRIVTGILHALGGDGQRVGVLGGLLGVHDRGVLTRGEVRGLAASLFFDGAHLAAAQLATALLCLLLHPEQLTLVRTGQAPLSGAVEEVLRYSPAITLGMARDRTGQSPSGPATCVAFGPVNRDPAAFTTPDVFDITQHPSPHLSFGRGIHHCLGAHLTRLQLSTALRVLLLEHPVLRLATPPHTLAWTASPTLRTLTAVPLTWH